MLDPTNLPTVVGPAASPVTRDELRLQADSPSEKPLIAAAPPMVAAPQVDRPARVLLGWLPEEQARLLQNGLRDGPPQVEHDTLAAQARLAVQARGVGLDEHDVVNPAPRALENHIAALRSNPLAAQYFAHGWQVALVDLTKVCAAQPFVFMDHADERVASVDASDIAAIASLTLPLAITEPLNIQYDQARHIFIIASRNPNLRIGTPANQVVVGGSLVGFGVGIAPSFLKVARLHGRHVLCDGYHRSSGLVRRGISIVPAFVRDHNSIEELGLPTGMLPQHSFLGDRPPVIPDYFDDSVSVNVRIPASQKMIVVQATELTPIG